MSLVTRCPVCATSFHVQRTQLAARGGKVRCGKCGQIFDGVASLVEEGAEPLKIEPSPQLGLFDPARRVSTVDDDAPLPTFMVEEEESRRGATVLWALAALLLAAALGAQLAYRFRAELAAHFPAAREPLAAACRAIGCQVRLPRRADQINIESSDLQADPRQEGVIVLNALLRSRAAVAQEYPSLELTLTDEASRPVLRRVLAPRDYVDAGRAIEQGIPAGAELALRIYLDAGRARPTDYRLYLFYP
ncbi:MAG TPA: DUF3426 domain-containing protein [Burkholderiales bacterium]|jgi:predicted Zn finger-like uncharacterized protein